MVENNPIEAEDLYYKWLGNFDDDPEQQFLSAYRREVLQILVEMFYNNGISLEEAKGFTNRIVKQMTTEKGRKGQGNYKGWKENVEKDYKIALANYYVAYVSDNINSVVQNNYSNILNIVEDPMIVGWCKDKFKNNYSNDIKKLSHQLGHSLNLLFLKDVFESNWVLEGNEDYPDWYYNY